MFEKFDAKFTRDPIAQASGAGLIPNLPGLPEYFAEYGGVSFGDGLYRVVRPLDLQSWQERIAFAFPDFPERVVCFAYDWAGRAYALDTERLEQGQAGVLLLEPGTGEVLRIPSNLQSFHNDELVDFGEAALGISFYHKWRAAGGEAPSYDQCIGYRKPLFLSGVDDVENLEVSDLDVYWHIMGQLIEQTRGLPPGTPIRVNLS